MEFEKVIVSSGRIGGGGGGIELRVCGPGIELGGCGGGMELGRGGSLRRDATRRGVLNGS
jgi:hypothetical protein